MNGVYRIVPKIDLTGFEHKIIERRLRFRDSRLEEGATPAEDERSRIDPRPSPTPAMIQEAARIDRQRLQGAWKAASGAAGGQPGASGTDVRWIVTGDKIVIEIKGRWEGTLTLDPARSPRRIDIAVAGPDGKKELFRGLYELRGDELWVCMAPDDEPRPDNVRSSPGTGQVSFVLNRELAPK